MNFLSMMDRWANCLHLFIFGAENILYLVLVAQGLELSTMWLTSLFVHILLIYRAFHIFLVSSFKFENAKGVSWYLGCKIGIISLTDSIHAYTSHFGIIYLNQL